MAKDKRTRRHENMVYFKDEDLDFYLQASPVGYATYGGATAGEALFVSSQVDEKSPESWVEEWSALPSRVEEGAERSFGKGYAELAYLASGGFVERAGQGAQLAASGLERLGELLVRMLFAPTFSGNLS